MVTFTDSRAEQALHRLRVVQHLLLQARDRLDALLGDAAPEPPAQRAERVPAEVEPVVAIDRLEQQLDLYALQLAAGLGRYRYSHTCISDRSCSMSTGFVM